MSCYGRAALGKFGEPEFFVKIKSLLGLKVLLFGTSYLASAKNAGAPGDHAGGSTERAANANTDRESPEFLVPTVLP